MILLWLLLLLLLLVFRGGGCKSGKMAFRAMVVFNLGSWETLTLRFSTTNKGCSRSKSRRKDFNWVKVPSKSRLNVWAAMLLAAASQGYYR